MKEKVEASFDSGELATYLESLAQQLRNGKLIFEERKWTVPARFPVKIRFKEKKGWLRAKLSWRWSSLADYNQADQTAVAQWQDSFKGIKKRLGRSFKTLRRVIENGQLPEASLLSEFIADSKAFAQFAEPEWQDAMAEYLDHMANLQRAFEKGQIDVLAHEIRDIKNRMRQCHQEFA